MPAKKGLMIYVLMDGQEQAKVSVIRDIQENDGVICYICLNDTAPDASSRLMENGLDTSKFMFIDTLSSYYPSREEQGKYVYVSSPSITDISKAVLEAREKCSTFLFDSISALLRYHDSVSVMKMTNTLIGEAKMVYLLEDDNIIPENEMESIIADLSMFADETVRMS